MLQLTCLQRRFLIANEVKTKESLSSRAYEKLPAGVSIQIRFALAGLSKTFTAGGRKSLI